MKAVFVFLLCMLLLAGCQGGEETPPASSPPPEPKTAQELLEEQPIDDTHGAFLVDTGGRMGTLLVKTELVPYEEPAELRYYLHVSIWDPAAPEEPVQIQEIDWETVHYGEHQIVDVNFDGYSDFTYLFYRGIQVEKYHCMLWDEEQGLFVELPVYTEIPSPHIRPEAQTITGWSRASGAGDGTTPVYQWVDGELVCVRKIEAFQKDWRDYDSPYVLTVEERVDGELTEVYRLEFPAGSEDYRIEQMKWEDLSYHGEADHQNES